MIEEVLLELVEQQENRAADFLSKAEQRARPVQYSWVILAGFFFTSLNPVDALFS